MRATVHKEVVDVGLRLFIEQGFDQTTVDQIAAEVGLSRASLFRYFGTKEDIVLGGLQGTGRRIAEALAARPDEERPWQALRRAFDVIVRMSEDAPEQGLRYLGLFQGTPSLRARYYEKQLSLREMLVPEIARRLAADPDLPEEIAAKALAAAALTCLDVSLTAWVDCEGAVPLAVLLDRALSGPAE
ncbi:TetR family transcriptional regulator [Streptomyces sp. Li-HN-5-11]|uniref:TetR family transcriptional regulator n=1 Tax=Streptomyces sp. Li-HN-5-11 TaxID=3075432 RepID=UPI0028AAF29B|nr:TetR family transcriptional regulator [Streptomyces sp. Li-HN-5-11]WNM31695.1 TetR family transcriptional regulator [Streptomyces sp. Li-HN-5-11]